MANMIDFHEPIFRKEKDGSYSVNADMVKLFEKHGYKILTKDLYKRLVTLDVADRLEKAKPKAKPKINSECRECRHYERIANKYSGYCRNTRSNNNGLRISGGKKAPNYCFKKCEEETENEDNQSVIRDNG